jgi:hypothetical protein
VSSIEGGATPCRPRVDDAARRRPREGHSWASAASDAIGKAVAYLLASPRKEPLMRTPRRLLPLILLLVALPALVGCGAGGWVDAGVYIPIGTVYAENSTAAFPIVSMIDFALWKSYVPPSGPNLLPFPLLPGEGLAVADVDEDTYDADALMSDGLFDYLESWFDVFVPGDEATTFFAY